MLAIRQLLAVRTTDRVDNALTQEIEELRALASEGSNPATGRPFGSDLAGIFRLYFQRNVPGEGESVITFLGGRPFTVESGALELDLVVALRRADGDLPPAVVAVPGDGHGASPHHLGGHADRPGGAGVVPGHGAVVVERAGLGDRGGHDDREGERCEQRGPPCDRPTAR